ncbi:MAG: carboxypeptidase regulatory-like domain-containing protein, partial [Bacteroidia bacterium]|nr:carboxypeptidase regulatory-like domain-containing protein [Bacteroidia bacterium]
LGNQNFVYINIHREHLDSISSNNLQLFLDFNLDRSIKIINGEYWLKPVLKPFGRHSSGEIEGKVRPVHSFGTIKAFNATDTAFARPEDEGEFKIRGLADGTYSLLIEGINGYQDTTITNIDVTRGHDTKLGTIQLHK